MKFGPCSHPDLGKFLRLQKRIVSGDKAWKVGEIAEVIGFDSTGAPLLLFRQRLLAFDAVVQTPSPPADGDFEEVDPPVCLKRDEATSAFLLEVVRAEWARGDHSGWPPSPYLLDICTDSLATEMAGLVERWDGTWPGEVFADFLKAAYADDKDGALRALTRAAAKTLSWTQHLQEEWPSERR